MMYAVARGKYRGRGRGGGRRPREAEEGSDSDSSDYEDRAPREFRIHSPCEIITHMIFLELAYMHIIHAYNPFVHAPLP